MGSDIRTCYMVWFVYFVMAFASSSLFATKIWVENKTDDSLKIRFSGAGAVPSLVEKVGAGSIRWGDNIFGLKLEWFSINDQKIKIPEKKQKGRYWYIFVQKKPFDLIKYTLFRINKEEVNMMHGGTLAARIIADIYFLGLFEILWSQFGAPEDIKEAGEKALTYVASGIVDKNGKLSSTYDEKYVINALDFPLTIQADTVKGKKLTLKVPAQQVGWVGNPEKIKSMQIQAKKGEYSVDQSNLKSNIIFAIVNSDPLQVVSFSKKDVLNLDLFAKATEKVRKWIKKTTPEVANSLTYKYFINATSKALDIRMSALDAKNQTLSVAPKEVGLLVTPSNKITSLEIIQGDKQIVLDKDTIEKQLGFYIKDLASKDGIIFTECKDVQFPFSSTTFLWDLMKYLQ